MPSECAAVGCSELAKKGCGLSFHLFPKDKDLQKLWLLNMSRRESQTSQKLWQPKLHDKLCSKHFEKSCFTDTTLLSAGFGMPMLPRLKPDAVPTIFEHRKRPQSTHRSATSKRQRREMIADLLLNHTSASGSVMEPSKTAAASVQTERCPLRYSTCDGITMECPGSDGLVAQPNSAISSITQTVVDRPHSCQRCSATFVLASSLRTHAVHIHGDGLPALLAESRCHPRGDPANHGDTTCGIEPDNIKMEICEEDSLQSNTLMSDNQTHSNNVHGDNVTDSHPGIFDDTTFDIKPVKIKLEVCEEDSIQSNTLMSDNQTHSNNVHGDNVTDSHPGIFNDTTCDIKPDKIKIEVCEDDSVHNNTLVSGTQMRSTSSHVHGKNVTDSHSGILDNPADDIKVDRIKIDMCQVDIEQSNTVIPDNQTHVSDVHSKHVTGSLRKHECKHKTDRPYLCTVCKKTFNRACSLRKHERSHSKDTHCACCM